MKEDIKNIMLEHLESINNEIDKLLEARKYVKKKIKIYTEMEGNINGKGK